MNHHLGMTINIDFRQPLNGKINTGAETTTPMTFQFSGDDDICNLPWNCGRIKYYYILTLYFNVRLGR